MPQWCDMPIFAADVLVLEFFAGGRPMPAGSKKALPLYNRSTGEPLRRKLPNGKRGGIIVNVVDDSGEAGKEWRRSVKLAARKAMGRGRKPFEGPVECEVLFVYPRPQSHYTSRGELKPKAPKHHATRPDSTKLWRAVEDALSGLAWADDGQVVRQCVRKRWASSRDEAAGVYVQIVAV